MLEFSSYYIFLSLKIVFVFEHTADPYQCRIWQRFIWVFIECQSTHVLIFSQQVVDLKTPSQSLSEIYK